MQQISLVWILQNVLQIRHGLTPFYASEREAVKTNTRWNPVTFSSKQQQAGWSTSSQAREQRKISLPSSAPDFTNSVFHGCKFWDWNTFLSSQVFEQFLGIHEPKAPSFRVFDPRGIMRINFTWQLVKFGPITVEIKLVKPIKFTLLPHVNHAHLLSDHHWVFLPCFYERFNCKMKINERVIK